MLLEASGRYNNYSVQFVSCAYSYDEALTLYDTALEENQNNAEFLKRKIAICKAKGQTTDAIKQLTTYLET